MPRKQKKYHFIYRTTNLLNGRYYLGMHSTDNLEDGYMGSGRMLRRSLKKYGKENHIVDILEFCNNRKELINKEKEIVDSNEISKKECMNLMVGGSYEFERKHIEEIKKQISETLKNKTFKELHGENAEAEKEKRRKGVKKYWDSISEEEREKRIKKLKGKNGKQKNPESNIACPYCKKEGRGSLMKRWHFENCPKLTGKKHEISEAHKKRIKEAGKKGRKGKKVLKFNSDKKIIKEFKSITGAYKDLSIKINLETFKKRIIKNKLVNNFYYKIIENKNDN